MKKFINTLEEFGMRGPFEAESKEDLADDVLENLVYGMEQDFDNEMDDFNREMKYLETIGGAGMTPAVPTSVTDRLAEARAEFIDGLEEV